MVISPVLYLSSKGDSFNLKYITDVESRDIDIQKDNIHPYLKKTQECKTYQTVLKFLQEIPEEANFKPYHIHNPKYNNHSLNVGFGMVKGAAHACSVKDMISFVQMRIKEKSLVSSIIFDKIAIVLRKTFHYLSICTLIPVIGIIPGVFRIVIGSFQILSGLALSILFSIPAYFFKLENAKIVIERSVRYLGHGPFNMLLGALQATPILGTWIYFKHYK